MDAMKNLLRRLDLSRRTAEVAPVDHQTEQTRQNEFVPAALEVDRRSQESHQQSGDVIGSSTAEEDFNIDIMVVCQPYNVHEMGPPLPPCEEQRRETVKLLNMRSVQPDEELEAVLRLLWSIFKPAAAWISVFGDQRVYVRNAAGPFARGDFPWRWSFCAWTLAPAVAQAMVIPDATKDKRFSSNQFVVGEPGVRCYCGVPLLASNGHRIGNLGFMDTVPRHIDAEAARLLCNLGELVARHLERDIELEAVLQDNASHLQTVYSSLMRKMDNSNLGVMVMDTSQEDWSLVIANEQARKLTGCPPSEGLPVPLKELFKLTGDTWQKYSQPVAKLTEFEVQGVTSCSAGSDTLLDLVFRPAHRTHLSSGALSIQVPSNLPSRLHASAATGLYFVLVSEHTPAQQASTAAKIGQDSAPPTLPGLKLGVLLGCGARTKVYRGTWYGAQVAVKVLQQMKGEELAECERLLSKKLSHPHILRTFDWATDRDGQGCDSPLTSPASGSRSSHSRGDDWDDLCAVHNAKGPPQHFAGPPSRFMLSGTANSHSGSSTGFSSGGGAGGSVELAGSSPSFAHTSSGAAGTSRSGGMSEDVAGTSRSFGRSNPGGTGTSTSTSSRMLSMDQAGTSGTSASTSLYPHAVSAANSFAYAGTSGDGMWGSYSHVRPGSASAELGSRRDKPRPPAGDLTGKYRRASMVLEALAGAEMAARASRPASSAGSAGRDRRLSDICSAYGMGDASPECWSAAADAAVAGDGGGPAAPADSATAAKPAVNPADGFFSSSNLITSFGSYGASTNASAAAPAAGLSGGGLKWRYPSAGGATSVVSGTMDIWREVWSDSAGVVIDTPVLPPAAAPRVGPTLLPERTTDVWVVMEFCNRGTLEDAIDRGWLHVLAQEPGAQAAPNLAAVLATASEVAAAACCLHELDITHGSLTPSNVLLTSADGDSLQPGAAGFTAKVTGFGHAVRASGSAAQEELQPYATLGYLAPEVLQERGSSKAADVYSLGVMLWSMYTGSRPWAGSSHRQLRHLVCELRSKLQLPDTSPPTLQRLVDRCMEHNPRLRPTAAEVMAELRSMRSTHMRSLAAQAADAFPHSSI